MDDAWRFEAEQLFDDDYLFFYADLLSDEVSDAQAELIWRLLRVEPGAAVLDLACGHGRIANRLAAKGAAVTGIDATPMFLDVARRDARERGIAVEYVHGDMRALPWTGRFDAAASVFTAFGYFDDEDNRAVLRQVHASLRPGGRYWLDLNHLPWLLANFRAEIVHEREGSWMIDRNAYDPVSGRMRCGRTVIHDGYARSFEYFVRLFTFPELRSWLLDAGFRDVSGYDANGGALTVDSPRMVLVAER